jgi:hypothetical protein
MSCGLTRTDRPIRTTPIAREATRRLTVRCETLRIAAGWAIVRSGSRRLTRAPAPRCLLSVRRAPATTPPSAHSSSRSGTSSLSRLPALRLGAGRTAQTGRSDGATWGAKFRASPACSSWLARDPRLAAPARVACSWSGTSKVEAKGEEGEGRIPLAVRGRVSQADPKTTAKLREVSD